VGADVNHVLLTRFNLPSEGYESLVRAKEGWLRERIALFERYCIPSVRAQTNQAFHWIIYFDPESHEWLKQRIENHVEDKLYTPIFRKSVSLSELLGDIRGLSIIESPRLITTNLDNDDALATDFVERIQKSAPSQGKKAVYLAHGIIKSGPRLYLRVDRTNAFCSVACDWASPTSCWSDWHTRLAKSMPSVELHGEPAWLQVVHGRNVCNRVSGRLVSSSEYTRLFPGLLDDVCIPTRRELLVDMFVSGPRRLLRDSGRLFAKNIVIRLLGKGSLDKAKIRLTFLRGRSNTPWRVGRIRHR
jgi:Putative rhamnosyl transferase